jgi:hypothetical protein
MENVKYEVVDNDETEMSFKNELTPTSKIESVDEEAFVKNISTYIQQNNPKLYILTPCYGSMCHINYMVCLIATLELFKKYNFPVQVEFCRNDSLVTRARNNLIARAMNDPKMTHCIFIDSDITWTPLDVIKLIMDDKPLIGGIYPLKKYNWDELMKDDTNPYNTNVIQNWLKKKNESQLKHFITDSNTIQAKLLKYNINYLENVLNIDNNIAKVKHIPTGFMMIQRTMIQQMIVAFPSTKYVDDVGFLQGDENNFAYALFDTGVEGGHFYSEDWMICDRWSKMGGEVYVNVSINLTHSGQEDFKGSFITSLLS